MRILHFLIELAQHFLSNRHGLLSLVTSHDHMATTPAVNRLRVSDSVILGVKAISIMREAVPVVSKAP
jgi:hypothetical protein